MSERHRHPDNVAPTQPDSDDRDVFIYLNAIVDKRIKPSTALDPDAPAGYNCEQSDLHVSERPQDGEGRRRFRLRLRHPDSTVSDVGLVHTAREMDAFLRGLSHGLGGTIERKADTIDDTEGEA